MSLDFFPRERLGTGRFPPSYRSVGQDERIMSMQQLAGWVRDRRAQLELTQEEVAALGPLSDKTVRTVESGRATGLRRNTRSALERVLQWQAGSVKDAIDHGLKPQPLADKPRPSKRRTEAGGTPQAIPTTPPIAPAGRRAGLGGDGLASAGASFAVARAAHEAAQRCRPYARHDGALGVGGRTRRPGGDPT